MMTAEEWRAGLSPTNAKVVECLQQARENWRDGNPWDPFSRAAEWLAPVEKHGQYHHMLWLSAYEAFRCATGFQQHNLGVLGIQPMRPDAPDAWEVWPASDTELAFEAAIELAWGAEY